MILRPVIPVIVAGLTALSCSNAFAYDFQVNGYTIDAGGGRSSGGVFEVVGTVGQPDAGSSSNASFRLDGGFWLGVGNPRRCTGSERVAKARCKARDGINELKVTLAGGSPGDSFVVMLTDGSTKAGTINERGKGKAKFRNRPPGPDVVTVTWGCGAETSSSTSCP